jgi:hypothetical protein
MSIQTPTPQAPVAAPSCQWPADVLAFAEEAGVAAYLDPLLEATRRLYPTARKVGVHLAIDPEIRGLRFIVFDAEVPIADVPDFVKAVHAWNDELARCCPSSLEHAFCLDLRRVD